MKLQNGTRVYVVDREGMSEMTFGGLHHALEGGTKLQDVEVFTDQNEARDANRANARLQRVLNAFSRFEILNAAKMVLLNEEGHVIHEVPFNPAD